VSISKKILYKEKLRIENEFALTMLMEIQAFNSHLELKRKKNLEYERPGLKLDNAPDTSEYP